MLLDQHSKLHVTNNNTVQYVYLVMEVFSTNWYNGISKANEAILHKCYNIDKTASKTPPSLTPNRRFGLLIIISTLIYNLCTDWLLIILAPIWVHVIH